MEFSKPPKVCIITACFNEEEVVEQFYGEVTEVLGQEADYDYELIFIDDGSTDGTLAILNQLADKDPRVGVYSLSRNFGNQIAFSAGLDMADGEALILMDCDLQHPPDRIPEMLAKWRAGAEVVTAIRRANQGASSTQRGTSLAFYKLFNLLSDTSIPVHSTDFCLISKSARQALLNMPERHRFLRGMIAWIGFPRTTITFDAPKRAAGVTKFSWRKLLSLASTAIFSFSARPLIVATRLGLVLAGLGMMYLVFVVWARLFLPPDIVQPGWASIIGVILLIGGMQLIFTGLIGEYIARIYEETKQRPLYFFRAVRPSTARWQPTEAED